MKKIIKYLSLLFLSICLLCFLYLRFGGYLFLDSEIRKEVVVMIKNSPPLPERFYELYEVAYPGSLSTGLTYNLTRSIFSQNFFVRGIPSYQASNLSVDNYPYTRSIYLQHRYYIEDQTTQRECLNFVASRMDFLYNTKGIREASVFYLEKELEELDDREMATLIVMIKNTSLYNPIRRPKIVEEAVDKVMESLEENDNQKKSRTLMQLFNVL